MERLKKGKNQAQKAPKTTNYDKYCWTHGSQCGHTSAVYFRRAEGHQKNTTAKNRMGGREQKWRFAKKNDKNVTKQVTK